MLVTRRLSIVCPTCSSSTAYDETCRWCGKPVAIQPRPPTKEEAARIRADTNTERRVATRDNTDDLLLEIELVQAKYGYSDSRIGRLLQYHAIVDFLRNRRKLRCGTRAKLLARLRQIP